MATAEGGAVMRRLVDETNGDAGDLLLGRLLRDLGPLPESDVAKLRVRRAVLERTSGMAARQAAGSARLRMALAACALLVIGGIAGATVGRAAWERLVGPAPGAAVTPPHAAPSGHTRRTAEPTSAPGAVASPALPAAPAADPSVVPAAVENAGQAAVAAPAPAARRRAAPATAPSVGAVAEDLASPTALAKTALKEVGENPARSRVLAEDYLSRQPGGMVAEEMHYVLVIAAVRLGDADAAQLAARYLERYPSGRFAAQVREIAAR